MSTVTAQPFAVDESLSPPAVTATPSSAASTELLATPTVASTVPSRPSHKAAPLTADSPVPAVTPDVPGYTANAVLALSADAVLPSGRTFRECVTAPPNIYPWPSPVHLYYLGAGAWRIETHDSSVGVTFHEATGKFTVAALAPGRPGC